MVALGRELGDRRLELLGRRLLIVALLELGEVTERRRADQGIQRGRRHAPRAAVPLVCAAVAGHAGTDGGRIDESSALCDDASAIGAHADSVNAAMLTLTQQWVRLRVEGRLAEAAQLIDDNAAPCSANSPEPMRSVRGAGSIRATRCRPDGCCGNSRATSPASRMTRSGSRRWHSSPRWRPGSAIAASAAVLDAAMAPSMLGSWSRGSARPCTGRWVGIRAPLALLLGRDEEAASSPTPAVMAAERMGSAGCRGGLRA